MLGDDPPSSRGNLSKMIFKKSSFPANHAVNYQVQPVSSIDAIKSTKT